MSNHYDYMPKPEGWTPPIPETEISEKSDKSDLSDQSDKSDLSDKSDMSDRSDKSENPETPDVISFEDTTPAEKAITKIANILSWLFVPLLMPTYGILLIFNLSILSLAPTQTKVLYTLIVFGANFLLPMLMVVILKKMKLIDDIGLNGRRERVIPYVITIICLLGTGWFLHMKGAPLWVAMFFAGGALAGLINMIVNFWWKISAHAAGIAGIVAMLIQIVKEGFPVPGTTLWIVATIILAGLLCSARVWLGRHTLMQVLAGTAVGFLSVWSLSLF